MLLFAENGINLSSEKGMRIPDDFPYAGEIRQHNSFRLPNGEALCYFGMGPRTGLNYFHEILVINRNFIIQKTKCAVHTVFEVKKRQTI